MAASSHTFVRVLRPSVCLSSLSVFFVFFVCLPGRLVERRFFLGGLIRVSYRWRPKRSVSLDRAFVVFLLPSINYLIHVCLLMRATTVLFCSRCESKEGPLRPGVHLKKKCVN